MDSNQALWTSVDHYFNSRFMPADEALTAALTDSVQAEMPPIHVSPSQGKLLHLLIQMHQAKRVLEIGTLGGYSTIWIARALPSDGQVISLEIDPQRADIARNSVARAGFADRVDIRTGSAHELLPQLQAEEQGPFDFIFIDADKPSNPIYLEWALKLSRKGSMIFLDNAVRKGAVADESSDDADVQGVQQFTEMVAKETRLSATVVQTVGEKGYDGFVLAVVVGD